MMGETELHGLARWEDRFSKPDHRFGTEPNVFLKSCADRIRPGMRALSIADGEGRNGVWLAERGCDVTAIDFSPTALAKASALASERGVALVTIEADITGWDWPEAEYDLIVGIFFQFLGPAARADVFAKVGAALKPGGVLLIQGYGLKQLAFATGGPSKAENLYTEALIRDAFGSFSRLDVREHEAVLAEGTGHVGPSALVDVTVVK